MGGRDWEEGKETTQGEGEKGEEEGEKGEWAG